MKLKVNLKQVLEGFKNDWFPPEELRQLITDTSEERLAICKGCPFNSTPGRISSLSRCLDCKCFLTKKTKCLSCQCPQNKWQAIVTEDEDKIINKALENDSP